MASINKAIIVGNLGRDPETRYTADGGTAITSLSVATTRRYRNADGQTVSETEWHRIVLFSRLAEIAKEEIIKDSCFPDDNLSLVDRCVSAMRKQRKSAHVDQKELLRNCLVNDCEYPLEVIKSGM